MKLPMILLTLALSLGAQLPKPGSGSSGGGGSGSGDIEGVTAERGVGGGGASGTVTVYGTNAVRTETTTTGALAATDSGGTVRTTNAAAVALSIAQAGGAGFEAGRVWTVKVEGAAGATITPTTSTIGGGATLVIPQGQFCVISSDGTNYQVPGCGSGLLSLGSGLAATSSANGISLDTATSVLTTTNTATVSGKTLTTPILTGYTIGGTLPAAGTAGRLATITNGATASDCTTGGGAFRVFCEDNGAAWSHPGSPTVKKVYGASFFNGGAALEVAASIPFSVPTACTVTAWTISVDAGTATFKVWKVATGTAIPTVAEVINTVGVSISTGTHVRSTTISDFTDTTWSAGDVLRIELDAVATATMANFGVECLE